MSEPSTLELSDVTLLQKVAAEALGTFVLVFFGCFSIVSAGRMQADYLVIALAFGLTVLGMAYAFGHISGGHFNPSVSLGAAIAGRLSWLEFGIYAATQIVAGIIAAAVLWVVVKVYGGDHTVLQRVANSYRGEGRTDLSHPWLGALLLEFIVTMVFVLVVLGVTDKRRENDRLAAPIAIGLTLTLAHIVLIPFTGASVNFARSLGPALFSSTDIFEQQWVFLIAPALGAAAAGGLYVLLYGWDRPRPVRAPKPVTAGAWPQGHQAWPQQPVQQGGWGQQGQLGLSAPQQWGTPAPPQPQPWQQQVPPPAPPAPGQEYPGQAAPGQTAPGQSAPGNPGQWGHPADYEEDGRTQIRPQDS